MLNTVHLSQRGSHTKSQPALGAKRINRSFCQVSGTIEKTKPRVTGGRKATGPNAWDSRVAFGKVINILLKGKRK
jgi:hypothetical protein